MLLLALLAACSASIVTAYGIDRTIAVNTSAAPTVVWTPAHALGLGGRAYPDSAFPLANMSFARLPAGAQADVNPGVWEWSLTSAGLFLEFSSNATAIHCRYTLRNTNVTLFSNFSPLGFSGVDLYAFDAASSAWRWVASGFDGLSAAMRDASPNVVESPLFSNASGWPVGAAPAAATQQWTTRYRLHLPSYNGVLSLDVGVPAGATLTSNSASWKSTPVIYLGTSITQGGLTPRPGDAYVSRLSRTLPTPVVNLGFCGSCRLEPGLAKWVGVAAPPRALVIDCTANMSPDLVRTNTAPFVRALRALPAWATLPIVLVEPIDFTPGWLLGETPLNRSGLRAELRAAYEELVTGGDAHLVYVPGSALRPGADAPSEELTYEGVHPLDRGHALFANAMRAVLLPLVLDRAAPAQLQSGLEVVEGERLPKGAASTTLWAASAPGAAPDAAAPAVVTTADFERASSSTGLPDGQPRATAPPPDVQWTDATTLTIRGRAFNDTPTPYNRFPASANGVVPPKVWELMLNSAGLAVAFSSDSPTIWVDLTLASSTGPTMPHFAASGTSGCDLYAYDTTLGRYRFVAPSQVLQNSTHMAMQMTPPGVNVTTRGAPLRWLLWLPTYNTATRVLIGTTPGFTIAADDPFVPPTGGAPPLPLAWYGTSILQGGVSSKVGHIQTARTSVALSQEVFNFGVSGSCKMELTVAGVLATLGERVSALIVDCSWNVDAAIIAQAAVPFVRALRAGGLGKNVSVWLVEGLPFGRNWAVPSDATAQAASNAALRAAYEELVASGDAHVFYGPLTGEQFGPDALLDSGTAAGLHAADQGMHDMTAAWMKRLKPA